jgi:hypothetical protein
MSIKCASNGWFGLNADCGVGSCAIAPLAHHKSPSLTGALQPHDYLRHQVCRDHVSNSCVDPHPPTAPNRAAQPYGSGVGWLARDKQPLGYCPLRLSGGSN